MVPGAVFERVYASLKEWMRDGRFRAGERLEPASLASDLSSSVTPVRDALHRLVGERMVDAPRQNGFRVPLLTEIGLRQLYAWHGDLLALSAARAPLPLTLAQPLSGATPAPLEHAARLFSALGEAAGNGELIAVLRSTSDRLMPYRLREEKVLVGCGSEAEALAAAAAAADRVRLRRGLAAYHRRRLRAVPELVAITRAGPDDRGGLAE